MKKVLFYGFIGLSFSLLGFVSCSKEATDHVVVASSPLVASQAKKSQLAKKKPSPAWRKADLLAYLDGLVTHQQLLLGVGLSAIDKQPEGHLAYLTDISGREVALLGMGLGALATAHFSMERAMDHGAKGGLLLLDWYPSHPLTTTGLPFAAEEDTHGSTTTQHLLKPSYENGAWVRYKTEIDAVAGILQAFRDAGMTVLWNPFPDANTGMYWWGVQGHADAAENVQGFKQLWKELYHTLTYSYGLDNLIWTYSGVMPRQGSTHMAQPYPGSDYVDMVRLNLYDAPPHQKDLQYLKALGKTLMVGSHSFEGAAQEESNTLATVQQLQGSAACFLWGLPQVTQRGFRADQDILETMNSAAVITLDEAPLMNAALPNEW